MQITITVPDAQAGSLSFYRDAVGVVHLTKSHVLTIAGGASADVQPFDAPLAAALTALVTATTITAPQRTAFTAVLAAINTYATQQAGL